MKLKTLLLLSAMTATSQAATILDLSTTATATASNGTAGNAIDRDSGTRWNSEGQVSEDPAWLLIDLGSTIDLAILRIDWERAGSAEYTVRTASDVTNFTLDDTDFSEFTTVGNITGHSTYAASGADNDGLDGTGAGNSDVTFDWENGTVSLQAGLTATTSTASTGASGQYLLIHSTARTTSFGNSIHEIEVSEVTPVPEPSSAALLGLGGLGLLLRRRR